MSVTRPGVAVNTVLSTARQLERGHDRQVVAQGRTVGTVESVCIFLPDDCFHDHVVPGTEQHAVDVVVCGSDDLVAGVTQLEFLDDVVENKVSYFVVCAAREYGRPVIFDTLAVPAGVHVEVSHYDNGVLRWRMGLYKTDELACLGDARFLGFRGFASLHVRGVDVERHTVDVQPGHQHAF